MQEFTRNIDIGEPQRPKVAGISIDPLVNNDIEQITWVEKTSVGWRCQVSIADATVYVEPHSKIDREAKRRRQTNYRTGSEPLTMLPPEITYEKLSLLEGSQRPTVTIDMEIETGGRISAPIVYYSQGLNLEQYSYFRANEIINGWGQAFADAEPQLSMSLEAAQAFQQYIRGCDPKRAEYLDVELRDNPSSYLVNCLMTAANFAAARFCQERGIEIIYKDKNGEDNFASLPQVRQKMFDACLNQDGEAAWVLLKRYSRIVNKAGYTTVPLALPNYGRPYAQVTAPMRRYVDLVNWQQIGAYISGFPAPYTRNDLEEIAADLSMTTQTRTDRFQQVALEVSSGKQVWDQSDRNTVLEMLIKSKQLQTGGRWIETLEKVLAGGSDVSINKLTTIYTHTEADSPLRGRILELALENLGQQRQMEAVVNFFTRHRPVLSAGQLDYVLTCNLNQAALTAIVRPTIQKIIGQPQEMEGALITAAGNKELRGMIRKKLDDPPTTRTETEALAAAIRHGVYRDTNLFYRLAHLDPGNPDIDILIEAANKYLSDNPATKKAFDRFKQKNLKNYPDSLNLFGGNETV